MAEVAAVVRADSAQEQVYLLPLVRITQLPWVAAALEKQALAAPELRVAIPYLARLLVTAAAVAQVSLLPALPSQITVQRVALVAVARRIRKPLH
jgi:hypothetical protein